MNESVDQSASPALVSVRSVKKISSVPISGTFTIHMNDGTAEKYRVTGVSDDRETVFFERVLQE